MRLVLILAFVLAAYIAYTMFKRQKDPTKRWQIMALTAAIVLLAAFVTGHLHWVGAAIGGAIAALTRLMPMLIKLAPMLGLGEKHTKNNQETATPQQHITQAQALQILGLEPGASKEEIVAAHRKLIQKMHPDRGGSDYMAAQINTAKEVLLKK